MLGTLNAIYIVKEETRATKKQPTKQVEEHPCAKYEKQVQELQVLLDQKVTLIKTLQQTIAKSVDAAAKYQNDLDCAHKEVADINKKLQDALAFLKQYKDQEDLNKKAYQILQKANADQECLINDLKVELAFKTGFINSVMTSFKKYDSENKYDNHNNDKHDDDCDEEEVKEAPKKNNQKKRVVKKTVRNVGSALA